MIWDDVEIGDGSIIVDSIIANGVRIGPFSTVGRGCLIGEKTVLGRNASLPNFSKVASCPPRDDDWEDDDDDDEEEEEDSQWRLTDRKSSFASPNLDGCCRTLA